jgi:hypothetical protein
MKKFYVALMAMILVGGASFTFAQNQFIGDGNYVWWGGNQDANGSNATVIEQAPTLKVEITLEGDNGWAYVDTPLPDDIDDLVGLSSIDITYKASGVFRVSINTGISDGSAFMKELPAATSLTPTNIPVAQFQRPNWPNLSGTMNILEALSDGNGIVLTVPNGTGGTFEVSSLVLNFSGNSGGSGGGDGGAGGGGTGGGDDDGEYPGYIELVGYEWGNWTSYVEGDDAPDRGSRVNITSQNPLTATMKLGESDDDAEEWAWHGLLFWLSGTDFSPLTKVEVKYTSDKALDFSVGTGETNEQKITLPAGTNQTREMTISSAKAASFGREAGVTFSLSDNDEGQTVTLTVTSVKLYGMRWEDDDDDDDDDDDENSIKKSTTVSLKKAANIAVTGISAGKIGLTVPTTGNYSVGIYSIDGKMLAQTKVNLVQGVNSLTLGKNLAKGIAIVRIQGTNTALVKKISIK